MGAAAGREQRAVGHPCEVAGDVTARVAHPHDEHPPIPEAVRGAVVVGMKHAAGERAGQIGHPRQPVMTAGHEHTATDAGLGLAARGPDRHGKRAVGLRHDPLHRGAKPDPITEAEVIDVVVEIPADLLVPGEVGVVLRHGMIGERGPVARGVDLQRLVDRRHAVVVVVPPEPADARSALETLEREAAVMEGLRGGET